MTCGILVPWPGLNPHSPERKQGVLTTGLPEVNEVIFLIILHPFFFSTDDIVGAGSCCFTYQQGPKPPMRIWLAWASPSVSTIPADSSNSGSFTLKHSSQFCGGRENIIIKLPWNAFLQSILQAFSTHTPWLVPLEYFLELLLTD